MCCVCVGDGRGAKGYNEDYTDSVIAGWPIVRRLQNVRTGYKASLVSAPDRGRRVRSFLDALASLETTQVGESVSE